MPSQEEILSRLAALGTTAVGGNSAYAGQLPLLDSDGHLDPSFFSSVTVADVYEVADEDARLALGGLKVGDTVVQAGPPRSYMLADLPSSNPANWVLTGITNIATAGAIDYTAVHNNGNLTGYNGTVFGALSILDLEKLSLGIANVIVAVHTFDTGGAPFAIGASSLNQLVAGLNAERVGGSNLAALTNASNLSAGTLPTARLTGTYPISISGNAVSATTAVHAISANLAQNAINSQNANEAATADLADEATLALDSQKLDSQDAAFYRNAGNLDAGLLLPGRFNDTSHGLRAGGNLHALASDEQAGFMSPADFCKLEDIESGAEANNNAFVTFAGTTGSTSAGTKTSSFKFDSGTPQLSITVAGGSNASATWAIDWASVLHNELGGLTVGDPHTQYVHIDEARTITVAHVFNPAGGIPFSIGPSARGTKIEHLDADMVDNKHASFFQDASNLSAGIVPPARLSGTYNINITGAALGGLPSTGGSLSGPLTVPELTIAALNGVLKANTGLVGGNATTSDLPEGSRLYFTEERVDDRVAALLQNGEHIIWTYNDSANTLTAAVTDIPDTTDDLTEGATNKYFTIEGVRAALSAVPPITFNQTTGQIGINAEYVNTPNTLVFRDSNGDFAASNITVNAPTAGGHATNKTYVDSGLAGKSDVGHIHSNASPGSAGFMSAADKVAVDRLSVLLSNIKQAQSFCPVMRLEGPSSANVLFYNQRSAFVRGDSNETYTLTVRVRGWFKQQHGWGLKISNPGATLWFQEATTTLPEKQDPSPPQYVDEEFELEVKGKSTLTLFYYLRDGLIPDAMTGPIDNQLPDLATFNGTYVVLEPVSLVGNYNAYTPDILPVSIDGEMVGGLLSGFTPETGLDGESSDDIDDIVRAYTNNTAPPEFPDLDVVTSGKVDAFTRRCNVSALNKIEGFNGYLRVDPFVRGRHPSARITDDVDHLDEILVNSGKLYQNIVSQQFTLGTRGSFFTITSGTTFQELFDQIRTNSGLKLSPSYNPSTDRITITNSEEPEEEQDAEVYYNPANGGFLGTIRASANETHRTTVISLPVASGIRTTDTLKAANFKLPVYPDSGQFVINGVTFTYNATTDTVASTLASITSTLSNGTASYDPLANEFRLERESAANLPPTAYDVSGNLMQAMRLERENAGNPEFPLNAIHTLYVTETHVYAGGNFRSIKGATLPGLAKLDFDKQVDARFDTAGGFSLPVAFVNPLAGTTDVLVGCWEPATYRGRNRKYLFRIKADGTEDNTLNLTTQSITDDGQDRVLGAISLNDANDIAVLTPRELRVYTITGTLRCRYAASRAMHGLVKTGDNQFAIASNAYSGPGETQRWNIEAALSLDEPLGLRVFNYDDELYTVKIDQIWSQTPTVINNELGAGAGTGAEASCAYPIVGGSTGQRYIIAANRGALFGSSYTTGYGDTSWNSRESGNLLLWSDRFVDPENPENENWVWNPQGVITITEEQYGPVEYWTTLNRTSADDIAYIEQHLDHTQVRSRLDLAAIANPGSVGYRYMVKFIQDTGFTNKFPVMNVRLSGGVPENDRQVNCYVNLATGAVTLGSPTPPSMLGVTANSVTVPSGTGGPNTYIVTLSFSDDVVANTQVYCTVYPAYASVAGNPVEAMTGSCRISGASLMLTAWPSVYTRTTTQPKYPASGTNSLRFRGFYKIGLDGQRRGVADETWNSAVTYDPAEPHAHAIPFCVDSQNRVYVGGPITSIKNSGGQAIPVTPWRLYRLTANGFFDKEYDFNDKVLAAAITPCNRLVVGGKFSCCGRAFVGKLAYMSLDGAVLRSLTNYTDVIAAAVAPDTQYEPCNKTKLWLDTSAQPSVLKAWNAENEEWQAAVDTNSLVPRLPVPEFVVTYPGPGQQVNPSEIFVVVPNHSNATIYYAVNQDPRVLLYRQTYNELIGIKLENAGTYTVNVYAVHEDYEDSQVATRSFVVEPSVGTIEFNPANGHNFLDGGTVAIDIPNTNEETIYYKLALGTGDFGPEIEYTGPLLVEQNLRIRARATRDGYRDSVSVAEYTVNLQAPVIGYTLLNGGNPNSSKTGLTLTTGSSGAIIKYTTNGSEPTLNNGSTYTSVVNLLNDQLYINNQFVLKAKAFHVDNGTFSDITENTITRLAGVATEPAGTGILKGAVLTLTPPAGAGVVIRYTINGAAPTEEGVGGLTYTSPIEFQPQQIVNHQVDIKVRAFQLRNNPLWDSAIPSTLLSKSYIVQIPPPEISYAADSNLGYTKIYLTSVNSQTPTASIIRYTTDGTTPSKLTNNTSTTTYTADGIVTATIPNNHFNNNALTLKAIEYYPSDTYVPAVATFTVNRCEAPAAIQPDTNIVVYGSPVTVVPATNHAYVFYYTTNVNSVIDGTTVGTVYNRDTGLTFTNNQIVNGSVDLRVRAFRAGHLPSAAISRTYNMKLPPVYFDPFSGATNPGEVSLLNLVQGAVIKYTLTGASPTEHSRLYSNPITIRVNTTVKALATKLNWVSSEVSIAVYASTAYPSTPDHSLFNIKYGQSSLGTPHEIIHYYDDGTPYPSGVKLVTYKPNVGAIHYSGKTAENYAPDVRLRDKHIFVLTDPAASLVPTGAHFNNVEKTQLIARGRGAFGFTSVDFWNNIDVGDNENWKPLRNYGGSGNYANYLEARKFFGCTRAPLIGDPLGAKGPFIVDPNAPNNWEINTANIPSLLQNSGLTATPETDRHVMTHIRGLRAGKYIVIAYGRKTRFGIDMYSGTSVTGNEFYNYGVPAFQEKIQGKFYKSTVLDVVLWGGRAQVPYLNGVDYLYYNPFDALYYQNISYAVVAEGYKSAGMTITLPSPVPPIIIPSGIVAGARGTQTAELADECNFAVALIEAEGDNELEFHVTGRFDGGIAFGTNDTSKPIICALQIIPIEGYWQPPVDNENAVLTVGPFDKASYSMFHVHGGVNVGGTQPRFAGGFYRFLHSINSESSDNFNRYNMLGEYFGSPNLLQRVTAQTEVTGHYGWHACNEDSVATYWLATNPTSFLEVDFIGKPNIIDRYTLAVDADLGAPIDFTLQAWDGTNWVVLSLQSNQFVNDTGTVSKTYSISTPIAATKYRLVPTATKDLTPVKLYNFDLLGRVEDNEAVSTFINLPEIGRYNTGEEQCAKFTAAQKPFYHEGGDMQFAFEDITGHYNDNLTHPGLVPQAEGANSKPIKPIFALINISKISEQGRGTGGLPVLFDPPSGTVNP